MDQDYLYRCTTDKLLHHRARIVDAGDTVLSEHWGGGRDWVLICRPSAARPARPALSADGVPENISRADYTALVESVGFSTTKLASLRFATDGIYATVFALDADGRKILDRTNDTVAKHEVFVKVDD